MARMRRQRSVVKSLFVLMVVSVASLTLGVVFKHFYFNGAVSRDTDSVKAVFYYSPPCGCCGTYLPKLGSIMAVEVRAVSPEEFVGIKKGLGVPVVLQSCHTVVINGRYVEGHVPVSAVAELAQGGFVGVKGLALPHRETNFKTWEGPGYYVVYENGTVRRVDS
ncbi:DUF411 domain-containing protein [Pyrobaculum sp. 3827-6]|uniref:DUF411 domain-containing protein n=1 Tax=Pyrobaculum sp. 3827-6 TaxID=2983604 RepID=UPI0021D92C9F|nr:DUF411 domain-containing protein [Pyrobaculum sp. 3827-6]MCU7787656.1 DUF411 domain-containing protein [Pyrobaculum sp. 3827-6]